MLGLERTKGPASLVLLHTGSHALAASVDISDKPNYIPHSSAEFCHVLSEFLGLLVMSQNNRPLIGRLVDATNNAFFHILFYEGW